jgi:hypothetical protein
MSNLIEQELRYAGVAVTPANVAAVMKALENYGASADHDRDVIKIVIGHGKFESAPRTGPLPRAISAEGATEMYGRVLAANPWCANTEANGAKVAEVFMSDPRCFKRDLQAMVTAFQIASPHLERMPPPPKATFPDDLSRVLKDGTRPLPLDTSLTAMQSSSITAAQVRDWELRRRKYESWKAEHPDA